MKIIGSLIVITILILVHLSTFTSVSAKSADKVLIKVNLWSNELIVIKNNLVIKKYPIAPGKEESPTPIGVFKVNDKSKEWGGGFGSR
jgi:hypothetical protein